MPNACELTGIGDEIGSVEIDIEFSELVEKRLHTVAQDLRLSPKQQSRLITRMVREKFRTVKEDFGKSDVDARDLDVKIEMPGVSDTYSSKTANVYAGKMYFKRWVHFWKLHQSCRNLFDIRKR